MLVELLSPMKTTPLASSHPHPAFAPRETIPEPLREHSSGKKSHTPLWQVFLLLVALFFLGANTILFAYLNWKTKLLVDEKNVPTITPTAFRTPTPTSTPYPLPQGIQSFNINYSTSATGPKLEKVFVDPFDPQLDMHQRITIAASHTHPIGAVALTLSSDHKEATYSMERISGTDTQGVWQTTITTDDTHLYRYYVFFSIESQTGSFNGGLTFRAY